MKCKICGLDNIDKYDKNYIIKSKRYIHIDCYKEQFHSTINSARIPDRVVIVIFHAVTICLMFLLAPQSI